MSKLDETLKNSKKIDRTLLDIQLEILFSEFRDFIFPEIIPSAESIFNYLSSLFLTFKDSISRDEFFELRNIKAPPTPSNSNKKDLRLEVNLLHEKVKKLIIDNKPKFIDLDPNSFLNFETYQAFLDQNPDYASMINSIQMYNLKKKCCLLKIKLDQKEMMN